MALPNTLTLRRGPEDNTDFGYECCRSSTENKNGVYISIFVTVITIATTISTTKVIFIFTYAGKPLLESDTCVYSIHRHDPKIYTP
jgi:hypothetical protein